MWDPIIVSSRNMYQGSLSFSLINWYIGSYIARIQPFQVYFAGAHARSYVSANVAGINCMTSMSCMFRKKILDEEGGLASLSSYLGEDFFLNQLIINK